MRRRIIAGNWKMNKGVAASIQLAKDVANRCAVHCESLDLVICPTFLALAGVAEAVKGTGLGVGSQDCYHTAQGAYTGEVNPELIMDAGARYCIIGHSERRTLMAETDRAVNLKAKALLKAGILPIICVGETLEEKQAGDTINVVSGQVMRAFAGIGSEEVVSAIIAYEPVWAIGTGLNATAADAQAVCKSIRDAVRYLYGGDVSAAIRIQYGGSVKSDNMEGFMAMPDIDGALVGGASLKADEFEKIAAAAATA